MFDAHILPTIIATEHMALTAGAKLGPYEIIQPIGAVGNIMLTPDGANGRPGSAKDRFKLALHRESKTAPVYKLLVAKTGPNLEQSKDEGVLVMGATPESFVFRNAEVMRLSGCCQANWTARSSIKRGSQVSTISF